MTQPLPLALTMGDPAGVGPLLTWRAWAQRDKLVHPFFVIADPETLRCAQPLSGVEGDIAVIDAPELALKAYPNALPILAIESFPTQPGSPNPKTAPAIIHSIEKAVQLTNTGKAAAVVTNPINKALLYESGFRFPGHTEFLADLARRNYDLPQTPHPIMMLVGGGLRVALATIHMPLRAVPDAITTDLIQQTVRIVHADLKRQFGLSAPRIALAGLNPHAGEDGTIGTEERDIINPAAQELRHNGIDVSDAFPGDTVFHAMLDGQFDAIIAMYHDQGLAPLKSLDMWGGVNVTLGLPFIRTSPDHGTGYGVAADGSAKPDSLIAALKLASDMAVSAKSA